MDPLPHRLPDVPGHPPATTSPRRCHCRNSQCIKLYCECFRNEQFCKECQCDNCLNSFENIQRLCQLEGSRLSHSRHKNSLSSAHNLPGDIAPKLTMEDLGNRFKPQTCNCRNSFCRKKYCECFQEGRFCSDKCKCSQCKNLSLGDSDDPPDESSISALPTDTREELRSRLLVRLLSLRERWFPDAT